MISAKEAKEKSEINKADLTSHVNRLLESFDSRVQAATTSGKYNTEAVMFPFTQISADVLKAAEVKLNELGYKVHKTENLAQKNFTLALSWG